MYKLAEDLSGSPRVRLSALPLRRPCPQVVAGSITVIADWFSQQSRKKFMAKQHVLLREAAAVAEGVRHIVRERGEDPMAPAAADPEE